MTYRSRNTYRRRRFGNSRNQNNGSGVFLIIMLAVMMLYFSFTLVIIPLIVLVGTKAGRAKIRKFFRKRSPPTEAQSSQHPNALSTLQRTQSFRNRNALGEDPDGIGDAPRFLTLANSSTTVVDHRQDPPPPYSPPSPGAIIPPWNQRTDTGNPVINTRPEYQNEVGGRINSVNPLHAPPVIGATERRVGEPNGVNGVSPRTEVERMRWADAVDRENRAWVDGGREREREMEAGSMHLSAVASQSFEVKQKWFHAQLRDMSIPFEEGIVEFEVNRQRLLEDAFRRFSRLSPRDLHRIMRVTFTGELAQDAGGPLKEFLNTVVKDLVCGEWGMFRTVLGGGVKGGERERERERRGSDDGDGEAENEENERERVYTGSGLCYQIDPLGPEVQPDCMDYFEFLGKVLGKALWEHIPVDAHFTRTLYKHILDSPIELEDLAAIDPNIHNSLTYILSNDVTDLCLGTFTVTYDSFGDKQEIPLVENGENVEITEENKEEYVDLYLKWLTTGRVALQIEHLKGGLLSVIPRSLLSVFSCQELELLMSGMPTIDVDEWERYTMYTGEYYRGHRIVEWFWKAVRSFTPEQRAKLLQFATGTSRLPASGFSGLEGSAGNLRRFCVTSVALSVSEWPRAHTCFNRIDMPLYDNAQILEERLRIAVEVESVGFGMV